MKKLLYTNVEWDCDGEDPAKYGLESTLELPLPYWMEVSEIEEMIECDDTYDLVDYLSDNTGWCVFGCEVELADE